MNLNLQFYMNEALKEAKKGLLNGEVPIGAVVVLDGEIIGRGHNIVEESNHAFAHAEIMAIREASDHIGDWRLDGATLFTTLEPCVMCAGAIVHSRIDTLVYGASDIKRGFAGSILNIVDDKIFNHRVKVVAGILKEESSKILNDFFSFRRSENSRLK